MVHSSAMDMLEGNIAKKLLRFSLPLMLSGILQTLYNAADMFVVGNCIGKDALASVGATVTVYSIILHLFLGLSAGVDIATSRAWGRRDAAALKRNIDTALLTCLPIGLVVGGLGILGTPALLSAMGTPTENGVYDGAVTYLRVIMAAIPFTMLYNFCAAVMRTSGDTRRPFIYVTVSGVVNVVLNYVFVVFFDMGVFGVALGTLLSQALSAVWIFVRLYLDKGVFSFRLRGAVFSFSALRDISLIGLATGLQSSLFSVGNTFLQVGVNSFGSAAVAGNTAAETLENLLWATCSSFQYGCLTFVAQNAAAGRFDRVKKTVFWSTLYAAGSALAVGLFLFFTREASLSIFIGDTADAALAITAGAQRAAVTFPFYFLCGIMAVLPAAVQGLGHAFLPTGVNIFTVLILRISWLYTAFALSPTAATLYAVHPISWILTDLCLTFFFLLYYRRAKREARCPRD